MAEYMNKEVFLSSMGLMGDETKYGNRDAEHQGRSYSTYMSYEIMDSVEDSVVEEELVPVVHGKWTEKDNVSYDCIRMENIHWSTYVCSECAGEVFCNYAFCPNCGAHMKGGDTDD